MPYFNHLLVVYFQLMKLSLVMWRKVVIRKRTTVHPRTKLFQFIAETVTRKYTAAVICTLVEEYTCSNLITPIPYGDPKHYITVSITLDEVQVAAWGCILHSYTWWQRGNLTNRSGRELCTDYDDVIICGKHHVTVTCPLVQPQLYMSNTGCVCSLEFLFFKDSNWIFIYAWDKDVDMITFMSLHWPSQRWDFIIPETSRK